MCVGEGEGEGVRVRVGLAVPESLVFLIGPQVKRLLPKRGRGRDENKQIIE